MTEQPQLKDLGERIATLEGEMKHLATKDFVRELIVEQTKELNSSIQDSHRVLNQKIEEQTRALSNEMTENVKELRDEMTDNIKELRDEVKGVKSWQNRITGGGAALAILVSLAVAIGNLFIIVTKLT
ncbi:MAG: hypothetical protein OXG60_16205 [Chloroflexi bacterium]|nr:hypothetical protein [Chloroflexota bacterium]